MFCITTELKCSCKKVFLKILPNYYQLPILGSFLMVDLSNFKTKSSDWYKHNKNNIKRL